AARTLSVRATRLFHARPGFYAAKANLEPDGHVKGCLGQGSQGKRALSLEPRKRPVNARQHLFFSEHFQQVIETGAHIAPGYSKSRGMNDRADFSAEL